MKNFADNISDAAYGNSMSTSIERFYNQIVCYLNQAAGMYISRKKVNFYKY